MEYLLDMKFRSPIFWIEQELNKNMSMDFAA